MRIDPVSGQEASWRYRRNYGCGDATASVNLIMFRSAAAAYFDLERDGGTGNFGGFKSGCTSNLIAANGVLNAPDYTRTCICSYQNQTSLALIHTPEVEMWTFSGIRWGGGRVKRIGINFGAPGDRLADNGTLWIDYPSVGGPSPDIQVRTVPEKPRWFSMHSSKIEDGNLKWVAASGAEGISSVTVGINGSGRYTVRLYFAEPGEAKRRDRVFDVAMQGYAVLKNFDVVATARGARRTVVKQWKDITIDKNLTVEFTARSRDLLPLICGIEILAE